MQYISTKAASEKWAITEQLIRRYCRQERIPGAIQKEGAWLIPEDAKKPAKIEPMEKDVPELPPLAKKLVRQKKKKNFHGLYDYVQTDLTYSSSRMASNRLTRQQVETIFKKGKVSVSFEPMKVSDLVEVLNHCVCVDYILDSLAEHAFRFALALGARELLLNSVATFIFDVEAVVPLLALFSYRSFCHR